VRLSWSGGQAARALLVDAAVFLGEVVAPVSVEVAGGDQCAEFEDRFGAFDAPAGAGDVEAILDEVAAGAFEDAGGDGPAEGVGGVGLNPPTNSGEGSRGAVDFSSNWRCRSWRLR
jgi:hypothetical protein